MPLLVVTAVLSLLVWGTVLLRRGVLLGGCLVFLVVGYCLGHPFLSFDAGPVPLTLDRLLLVALAVGYLILRRLNRLDPKPMTGTDGILLALVLLLSCSTVFSGAETRTGAGGSPLWRLIASYWMPLLVYWLARQSRITSNGVRLVWAGLTVLGVYLAVTAVAEVTGQWQFVFPKYIADPTRGIHFGRARGPLLAAQSLGLYLSICLLCAWVLRPFVRRPFQLLLMATYPLLLAAIGCTYTRAAWLAVAAGLLVVLLLQLQGAWRAALVSGTLAAAAVLLAVGGDWLVGLQRESAAGDSRHSVYQRASFAYVSWQMFMDRPLFGVGFGNFASAKLPYLADRSVALELDSLRDLEHHNTFLSLLTEAGIVGLALFVAVLAGWSRSAWAVAHSRSAPPWARAWGVLMLGSVAVYVFPAMFHDVTLSPADQCLVFFLAGVTVGVRSRMAATPATDLGTHAVLAEKGVRRPW